MELQGAITEGFTSAELLPYYVTFETPFDPSQIKNLCEKENWATVSLTLRSKFVTTVSYVVQPSSDWFKRNTA